jgi:uncharacterized membrane protein YfcA
MSELLLFVLVTLGAFISSLTGLGGGTLILGGLLLVFPASLAIPLHSFTQLTSNGLRTGLFFKQVHWRVVGAYALLMVPAAWFGAKLFNHVNPDWLNVTVGLFILISVLPIRMKPKGEPRLKTFMILGCLSGFLGVFVGAVGPLVMPFFNRLKIERQGMLSTKSAGQTLLQLSKIIAFSGAGGVDFLQLKDNVLILILASLVGVGLSIPVSRKISDAKFDLILNVLLGLIAIKILYKGITGLL